MRQILADATGIEVAAPAAAEPVLLGSAILGSVAAGVYSDIPEAMAKMTSFDQRFYPDMGEIAADHDERFRVFEALQSLAREAAMR